jgi:hypothetical protein
MPLSNPKPRPRATRIWPREAAGFYIEPHWCSERLFATEQFIGSVWDCACGTGRIIESARNAGYHVVATDLIDRGYQHFNGRVDFLGCEHRCAENIVVNPPFDLCERFACHALTGLDQPPNKVAVIWLVRRLPAARWLSSTPRARHRRKGDRCEREIVERHTQTGIHAERYPLSGATRFRGSGHDVDLYIFGREEAPLVADVKARKSGGGFVRLERWLGEYDCLFLRRNNADPLVLLPWHVWAALLAKVQR